MTRARRAATHECAGDARRVKPGSGTQACEHVDLDRQGSRVHARHLGPPHALRRRRSDPARQQRHRACDPRPGRRPQEPLRLEVTSRHRGRVALYTSSRPRSCTASIRPRTCTRRDRCRPRRSPAALAAPRVSLTALTTNLPATDDGSRRGLTKEKNSGLVEADCRMLWMGASGNRCRERGHPSRVGKPTGRASARGDRCVGLSTRRQHPQAPAPGLLGARLRSTK